MMVIARAAAGMVTATYVEDDGDHTCCGSAHVSICAALMVKLIIARKFKQLPI